MKKLSDMSNKEIKNLLVSINAELAIVTKDAELIKTLRDFSDAKNGNKEGLTLIELVPVLINSLLVTNEQSLWRILAALTQSTYDEVQNMNNVETVSAVIDFFSTEAYRKLFSAAIKSAMKE